LINKEIDMTTKIDSNTAKGKLAGEQKKPEAPSVPTVTPDNDNGEAGPPAKAVSKNKTRK
jgi:hypothetical protein